MYGTNTARWSVAVTHLRSNHAWRTRWASLALESLRVSDKKRYNCHTTDTGEYTVDEGLNAQTSLLTVSPLCPGCPGSPSFPAGPWDIHTSLWMWVCSMTEEKAWWVCLQSRVCVWTHRRALWSWETCRSLRTWQTLKQTTHDCWSIISCPLWKWIHVKRITWPWMVHTLSPGGPGGPSFPELPWRAKIRS